jgi:hypothetical protein
MIASVHLLPVCFSFTHDYFVCACVSTPCLCLCLCLCFCVVVHQATLICKRLIEARLYRLVTLCVPALSRTYPSTASFLEPAPAQLRSCSNFLCVCVCVACQPRHRLRWCAIFWKHGSKPRFSTPTHSRTPSNTCRPYEPRLRTFLCPLPLRRRRTRPSLHRIARRDPLQSTCTRWLNKVSSVQHTSKSLFLCLHVASRDGLFTLSAWFVRDAPTETSALAASGASTSSRRSLHPTDSIDDPDSSVPPSRHDDGDDMVGQSPSASQSPVRSPVAKASRTTKISARSSATTIAPAAATSSSSTVSRTLSRQDRQEREREKERCEKARRYMEDQRREQKKIREMCMLRPTVSTLTCICSASLPCVSHSSL